MNKVIDRRPQCPPPLRVCLGAFIYPIRLFFARGIYYICSVFHIYPASLTTYRPRQPHSFSSSLNQPLILPIGVRPARKTSTTTHTIPNFHPVYRHCTVLRCTLRCALCAVHSHSHSLVCTLTPLHTRRTAHAYLYPPAAAPHRSLSCHLYCRHVYQSGVSECLSTHPSIHIRQTVWVMSWDVLCLCLSNNVLICPPTRPSVEPCTHSVSQVKSVNE